MAQGRVEALHCVFLCHSKACCTFSGKERTSLVLACICRFPRWVDSAIPRKYDVRITKKHGMGKIGLRPGGGGGGGHGCRLKEGGLGNGHL